MGLAIRRVLAAFIFPALIYFLMSADAEWMNTTGTVVVSVVLALMWILVILASGMIIALGMSKLKENASPVFIKPEAKADIVMGLIGSLLTVLVIYEYNEPYLAYFYASSIIFCRVWSITIKGIFRKL